LLIHVETIVQKNGPKGIDPRTGKRKYEKSNGAATKSQQTGEKRAAKRKQREEKEEIAMSTPEGRASMNFLLHKISLFLTFPFRAKLRIFFESFSDKGTFTCRISTFLEENLFFLKKSSQYLRVRYDGSLLESSPRYRPILFLFFFIFRSQANFL